MDPPALLSDLRAAVGDAAVSADPASLAAYRRDLWPRLTFGFRDGTPADQPAAIARPASEDAVVRLLRVCARHGIPVIPYGSGSGVCGGAAPIAGGVVIDLKRLDSLGEVEPRSLQVECGPGLILQDLEQRLNDAGYTLGHFPSSIYAASIGGCVAARGAGQLSSRYGKIEDMTTGLRVATAGLGLVSTGSLDPAAPAVDWGPVFIGNEGTLGLITHMKLRVHPLPSKLALRGVRFPSVEAGLEAFREILQDGLRPSVMRLYDPLDTWMAMQKANDPGIGRGPQPGGGDPLAGGARVPPPENATRPDERPEPTPTLLGSVVQPGTVVGSLFGRLRRGARSGPGLLGSVRDDLKSRLIPDRVKALMKPENLPADVLLANPPLLNRAVGLLPRRSLAILGCEGDDGLAEDALSAALATARRLGGEDLGAGPGERWFRTRYHVSFKLPKVLAGGGFADTFETAAPWTAVVPLYEAVRAAVSPHVLVMAHMSHAYHEGCSIYFTFAGYGPTPEATRAVYERTWAAALEAAQSVGAVLSHHHGIGLLKASRMDVEHGDGRLLFEAARVGLDAATLNPGKVFPTARPAPGPAVADPPPRDLLVHDHADGVIECGVDWRGVDLAAELNLRGHYLPFLGREFLHGTVGDWLGSPAWAAWTATHGAWEHPLQAIEGRTPAGRRFVSSKRPRSAAGPDWKPFLLGGGLRPVRVTLRTLNPPKCRPVGLHFDRLDAAAAALEGALRGAPRPLAGAVLPGRDPRAFRTVAQDAAPHTDGAFVWLALHDPDGFAQGSQVILDRLLAAGGALQTDDDALAWWEDHWAWPIREGADVLDQTGPSSAGVVGTCRAVVSWRRALLLLRAIETLTGGATRATGWIEEPYETGCSVVWQFTSSRQNATSSLVPWQLVETIRSFGARCSWLELDGESLPDWTHGGRGTPSQDGVQPDATRLGEAFARALQEVER